MNELSSGDITSLTVGIVSLILAIIFIQDKSLRLIIAVAVLVVIISIFFVVLLKEIGDNTEEIKKINEKIAIYERLHKLEAILTIKGDKK